jgi:uncharacterized protein YutE (UPF0331/DUF86 family)
MVNQVMLLLNIERIAKNKADILSVKSEIINIVNVSKENFLSDKKNILSLKYLLIQAVETVTDTCQHILAKVKGIACEGYVDCIVKAGEYNIIPHDLANRLRKLANLRNNLIHRYWIINDEELYNITRDNIEDLHDFVIQIDELVGKIQKEG